MFSARISINPQATLNKNQCICRRNEDLISKVQSHYQTNGDVKLIPDDAWEGHKLPEDIQKQLGKSKQTIDYKFRFLSELKDGIYELENKYLSESENGIDKLEIYKPKNKNNNKNRKITVKVIFC